MVNQQNNVSDYDGLEDEAFPPLPPPLSPGLGGGGGDDGGDPFADGDEEGDVSKLADVPAAKRKGVKRPQPKLDSNRLTSDRGLPALRTLFENVQFKGKGHEAENLKLLMQKMENWAHRLFPKLQFEDFIDKVEKLGNKKEVQTCLKRIRLDMPLTHEDFMGEEEVPPESNVFGDPDPFSRGSFPDELIHSTPAPTAPPTPAAVAPSPTALSPPAATASPSLTEEQRRRMELNRQRALERRLARQQQQTDSQPADSTPSGEPSSVSSANDLDDSKHHQQQEEDEDKKDDKKEEEEDKKVDEDKEEDKKDEEEDLDLQPTSSEQQPDPLSPKDSEPSEPPTETSRNQNQNHRPADGCEDEDQ